MCGIAEAAIATSIIGGITTAYGQMQAGKAANAEAKYKAAIQHNNAIRAGYLADDAIARGKEEKRKTALKGRLLVGKMRATLAANGVEVNSGSASDLTVDQQGINSLDVFTAENNAAREAQEYLIRADQFESEAALTRLSGANAARNSKFQAAGTLLTTAGSVAGKWYQFDKEGAFGGGGGSFGGGYGASI